jgi:hypothetical protein
MDFERKFLGVMEPKIGISRRPVHCSVLRFVLSVKYLQCAVFEDIITKNVQISPLAVLKILHGQLPTTKPQHSYPWYSALEQTT